MAGLFLLLAACSGGGGPEGGGTFSLVNLNVLHGVFCPPETDGCRAADRVALFARQLEDAGCPDAVALQEADGRILKFLERARPCDYEIVRFLKGVDREVVLTALPVLEQDAELLALGLRSVSWVRLDAEPGPVDVAVTHLASTDNPPCQGAERCPPPCDPDADVRRCQVEQVLAFVEDRRRPGGVAVIAGDLNAPPGSDELRRFLDAGWLDSHLEAGNAECDPGQGTNCTSGRGDRDLTDLVDPESRQSERIDYVLVSPGDACDPTFAQGTGLFNSEPAPGDLAFPSDHTAVALNLVCE